MIQTKKLKMKKVLLSILLASIIIFSPIICVVSGVLVWGVFSTVGIWAFTPNPSKPEITYGEFPFEIVYEVDGNVVTINDIYICQYDGIGANEGNGKYRSWRGYIKSTGEENLILLEDGNLKFACALGSPQYYMGDSDELGEYIPYIYYIEFPNEFGGESSGVMDIEPMLEKYEIKLISWKLSKPIQNTFK